MFDVKLPDTMFIMFSILIDTPWLNLSPLNKGGFKGGSYQ